MQKGDAFTKLLAVQIEQSVTMPVLLVCHCTEQLCRPRIGIAQGGGEVAVGPIVLFLQGHGERQQLLFRQF
jgi:hypothetical protein